MILTILDGTGTGSGSGGGHGTRRRYLLIGLLAIAVLLVAVLGFRAIDRLVRPRKEVWVAAANLPAGTRLGTENLRKASVSAGELPRGAVADARSLAGLELSKTKAEGEPFVREDFAVAEEQFVAASEMIPEGRVLTTVRVPKAMVPYRNLKNGDRVDLITVQSRRKEGGFAHVVARDAYLVGKIQTIENRPTAPRNGLAALVASSAQTPTVDPTIGLILAVHPEDAVPLAQALHGRDRIQVVLHGQSEVASGQLLELPEREATGVEYIAGSTTTRLTVTP